MSNYIKGNIDEEVAITSLAAKDVVGAVFDEVTGQESRVTSIVVVAALADYTPVAGAGPILFGVAHGDYTDAEIEEFLENTGQWDRGNMIASREIAKRLIRPIGTFSGVAAAELWNDGRMKKIRLNWPLTEGQTLRLWAFNSGDQGVSATGTPTVHLNGHANLFAQ